MHETNPLKSLLRSIPKGPLFETECRNPLHENNPFKSLSTKLMGSAWLKMAQDGSGGVAVAVAVAVADAVAVAVAVAVAAAVLLLFRYLSNGGDPFHYNLRRIILGRCYSCKLRIHNIIIISV